jgi:hypothetical protein
VFGFFANVYLIHANPDRVSEGVDDMIGQVGRISWTLKFSIGKVPFLSYVLEFLEDIDDIGGFGDFFTEK